MCNCIKETEERIKAKLSENNPKYKDKTIKQVTISNAALMFLDEGKTRTELYSPTNITYEFFNKNDELKTKKEIVNMSYSYCPFCGVKYD